MTNENYYNHYGLNLDPFSDVTVDSEYYVTPELEHRIGLIRHLLEFSDRFLVVTGGVGSGKTSLLGHFMRNSDEKWRICKLPFNEINTVEDFFLYINRNQGLEYRKSDSYGSKISTLQEYFISIHDQNLIPVLFIDDGHYLSIEILKLLFELAITEQKKPALHVVLFSETNIAELINHRNLGFIHSLDMPTFSEEQVKSYLEHRLMVAGYQGDSIISQKLVKQIHKTSDGLPGLINELATRALQDPAINKKETNYLSLLKSIILNPKYTIPFALVLCAFFVIYILQTDDEVTEPVIQSVEIALPENIPVDNNLIIGTQIDSEAEITVAKEVELPVVVDLPEAANLSEEVNLPGKINLPKKLDQSEIVLLNTEGEIIAEKAEIQKQTEEQEVSKDIISLLPDSSLINESPEKINEPMNEEVKIEETENKTTIPEITPEKTQQVELPPVTSTLEVADKKSENIKPDLAEIKTAVTTNVKKDSVPSLRGADWLNKQSPDHYVLQLMGAHDETAMYKFIDKNAAYKKDLAKFDTVNQDKVWHVLVFGLYKNRDEAVNAVPKLPAGLAGLKPWPRKIQTIQKDL